MGVQYYDLYVADGRAHYVGEDGFTLTSPPAASLLPVAAQSSAALLAHDRERVLVEHPGEGAAVLGPHFAARRPKQALKSGPYTRTI